MRMLTLLMHNNRHQLRQLIDILHEIELTGDQEMLLDRILLGARTLVRAEAGTIYLRRGNLLVFQCVQNDVLQYQCASEFEFLRHAATLPIDNASISGYVAQTGKMLNVHNVYEVNSQQGLYTFNRSYDEHTRYHTRSMLTLPLNNRRNELLGVIQLINARSQQGKIVPFFGVDLLYIRMFANMAAKAIERLSQELPPLRSTVYVPDALAKKRRVGIR